jgi:hypothetical protein
MASNPVPRRLRVYDKLRSPDGRPWVVMPSCILVNGQVIPNIAVAYDLDDRYVVVYDPAHLHHLHHDMYKTLRGRIEVRVDGYPPARTGD